MYNKSKLMLRGTLLIILAVISVLGILIALKLTRKENKIPDIASTPNPITQSSYPAPIQTFKAQAVKRQESYPPPLPSLAVPSRSPTGTKTTVPTSINKGATLAEVKRTPLKDAKAAFDGKKAIFLDVRSLDAYTRNHIAGAISIPETQIMEQMNELDPNRWIIAYCS
jgi:hypothetical protein